MIPGSKVTATGLAVMLLAVSGSVGSGDHGVLLGFVGVLIGANVIVVGVRRMGEEPATPTAPLAFGRRPGALLTAFLRSNLTVLGLIMASSAVTAVAGGEAGPVLCFTMFALLLLGLCFINIRVLGE